MKFFIIPKGWDFPSETSSAGLAPTFEMMSLL